MSFLNQLKSQATALQSERVQNDAELGEKMAQTEDACRRVLAYLQEAARQLSVIEPPAPTLSLDGKVPFPPMKLRDFRVDARRKKLRDKEVFDYIGMGWQVVPQAGKVVPGTVSVNFLPDLQRVESRLVMSGIRYDRKEIRHPEKNVLQEVRFTYEPATRGSVTVTAEHDKAMLVFRLANTAGFEVVSAPWPAAKVTTEVLDELAKRICSQPSRFV
ncbi:hypothetical protein [Ramlibacter albus]|uniref:Uncharacterized protein n=1 Tax=Ramlibacter albus TaxID=2079448 RepID=A0A923M5X9_9BURK|nr:hypothetical protein [Ramlibacter albus]MBC5764832.1 hypothetical protein [Ramlibacter albus]